MLEDETLTVIVAQKLRRSTGLISTLLVNMNHFHTKACRYRIENTGKVILLITFVPVTLLVCVGRAWQDVGDDLIKGTGDASPPESC